MTFETKWMSDAQRDAIVNLHIADKQNQPLDLADSELAPARQWLVDVLFDADKLDEHLALLHSLQKGATKHCGLLSYERAEQVIADGTEVLTNEEVAMLLLSPFSLHSLSDLLREMCPPSATDNFTETGRKLVARHDLAFELPTVEVGGRPARVMGEAPTKRSGVGWSIGFGDSDLALKRRMAETMYGDPDQDFSLEIQFRKTEDGATTCVAELKLSPAPVKDDLTITTEIREQSREFRLAVPPSVKYDPEADPPEYIFARASEGVSVEMVDVANLEAEWQDEAWPPHLVLR